MKGFLILVIGLLAAGYLVTLLGPILTPFIVGAVIAYLLDPPTEFLVRWRCSRSLAALLPVLAFFALILTALGLIIPALISDIAAFAHQLPQHVAYAKTELVPQIETAFDISLNINTLLDTYSASSGKITTAALAVLKQAANSTLRVFDLVSLFLLTPIVVFYMVRDWPQIEDHIAKLVPQPYQTTFIRLTTQMDARLSGFVRGQLIVMATLALFYAIGLQLSGLQMGLLIGAAAGMLSIIPFAGALLGFALAMGLALLQFPLDSMMPFAIIATVFAIGQILEGYVLTPKFIGEKVGLHPVWVIFAVMAGGQLGGFIGVIVAMPLASIMTVLVPETLRAWKTAIEQAN